MRSRYSAYVLRLASYLEDTWHAGTRPAVFDLSDIPQWLDLKVLRHEATGPNGAIVEFVARYKSGGRAGRMHEVSRFVREDGRWYYVDGDMK